VDIADEVQAAILTDSRLIFIGNAVGDGVNAHIASPARFPILAFQNFSFSPLAAFQKIAAAGVPAHNGCAACGELPL
jgi:hypothetical protein